MKKTLLATLVLGTSLALTGCFDKDTKESATNAATKAVEDVKQAASDAKDAAKEAVTDAKDARSEEHT